VRPITAAYSRRAGGPTQDHLDSLVREHSKSNPVPLTHAGARAIFEQTQPPGTWVRVAGDNVAGPDILYHDAESGAEVPEAHTDVKAISSLRAFDKRVKKALKDQPPSPVIAVQVPTGTDAARLMGRLHSNYSTLDVSKIRKQPFPQQRNKAP